MSVGHPASTADKEGEGGGEGGSYWFGGRSRDERTENENTFTVFAFAGQCIYRGGELVLGCGHLAGAAGALMARFHGRAWR